MESEEMSVLDAAHELRSPITARQLQADSLRSCISAMNMERFEDLRRGIFAEAT
jgi:two-component system OmpR family sensor kinase